MKRLMLLRHAKSSWEQPGQPDIQRPLNARGERAARLMGTYIRQQSREPDLILCSTACRTRETVTGLLDQFCKTPEVIYTDRLYLAEPGDILDLIATTPDSVRRLMVVGHNPGIHALAVEMIAEDSAAMRAALEAKFPTGGLALYKIDIDHWRDVRPGRLTDFQTPKNLV